MERGQIETRLRDFIDQKLLEGQGGDLTPTTALFDLGILDSFAFFSLIEFISTEFKITLELETMSTEQFRDLSTIAGLVHSKLR